MNLPSAAFTGAIVMMWALAANRFFVIVLSQLFRVPSVVYVKRHKAQPLRLDLREEPKLSEATMLLDHDQLGIVRLVVFNWAVRSGHPFVGQCTLS
uniref:Secreted protein n=1 Tax=Steinernema glaseri TaxID=37863 RepID=A0A1I7ZR77_9BILA